MLQALMERDKEKAIAAKERAAQAKAEKKANEAALKAAKDALLKAGVSHTPAVLNAKSGASPKASPKAKTPKKEGIELEQSRNQYLAHTHRV